MYGRISKCVAAKERRLEKRLQLDLYRYLHEHGIDFVVEPKLDNGEIDVIASIKGPDPRYIEAKVFDGKRRKQKAIIEGFQQIFSYVRDYNATTGYLAIYNLAPYHIGLDLDDAISPSLHLLRHSGASFYFLVINLFSSREESVQRGPYKELAIDKSRLIQSVAVP